MNSIFERRSIRHYQKKEIPDEALRTILRAGMYAPSAGNEQSWEFIVIRSRETLEALCNAHPYAKALLSCDTAIAVCGNLSRQKYSVQYWVLDCAIAGQNIMLEAHELGIGSVWLGVYPCEYRTENIAHILNVPDDVIPLSIIALGYPAETVEMPERCCEDKVHWEKW
jgi:nitroreductase